MLSAFAPTGHGSGKLVDLFGYTRYGKNNSPRAVLVGRHEEKLIDNGPYCMPETFDYDSIGQFKPKAVIVSR